jgi:hypothetical protein
MSQVRANFLIRKPLLVLLVIGVGFVTGCNALKNLASDYVNFFGRLAYNRYRIIDNSQGKATFYHDFRELKEIFQTDSFPDQLEWIKNKYCYLKNQPQKILDKSNYYALLRQLQLVAPSSLSDKKGVALYIPRSNRSYWGAPLTCEVVPMIAPALSGLSLIHGLPKSDCYIPTYGYATYNIDDFQHSYRDLQVNDLIKLTLSKGFRRAMILNADGSLEMIPKY